MRSVDAIPPLKFPYFKFKPAVFNGFRLLSGPAMTDHQRRALLRRHEHQTRRCGCYRRHTRRTPLPRPIMAADLGPNVSAAAAAACMSAGGRVWWWAVSRSRTPTTRCRAGACANGIIPGVCGRALDVRGRGCVGDGLLQRRDDRRKRTHERKAGPAEFQGPVLFSKVRISDLIRVRMLCFFERLFHSVHRFPRARLP